MVLATTDPTATQSPQVLNSHHKDYIYSIALDVYGRRMATVSGDRTVRIWEYDSQKQWLLTNEWQAHLGGLTDLDFAHPEFGTLLCTAGHDVKIWEENTNQKQWSLKATLTEARRTVTCVQFAPRHWRLKLATGSQDGCVRLYEAVDVLNLAQWPLAATLQAFKSDGVTALSWCQGRFDPPTLAVSGGSHVQLYRYSEDARAWTNLRTLGESVPSPRILDVSWAPNVGRSYHVLAVAASDGLTIYRLHRSDPTLQPEGAGQQVPVNVWRCQWNVTGTVLVTSGDAGVVSLYKANANKQYQLVSKIPANLSQLHPPPEANVAAAMSE